MQNWIFTLLVIVGFNTNAQEVVTDWKKLDGQISLKQYITNQAYVYLNFDPTKKDSKNTSGIQVSHSSPDTQIIIRDQESLPNIPLVVINQYPTDKQKVWDSIKLFEVKKITLFKPTEQTFAIYGTRGKNGLIFVEMDRRRWRKIKKKYGR